MIEHTEVAIVGSGFSGIGMAIRLKQAGIHSFVVLERSKAIGGTWRDNTYPGCACDISSHLYSYSFEPNPNWSRKYSGWREINQYMHHCVNKYGVGGHIRYEHHLTRAEFQANTGTWRLQLADRPPLQAKVLVMAVGPLSNPAVPDLLGLDQFKGVQVHSARWRHDLDFTGKRVAVIGTGASAIQLVPELARSASALTLFQRTPPWIMPKPDRPYSAQQRRAFAALPGWRLAYRNWLYWLSELSFNAFNGRHSRLRTYAEKQCRAHIQASIDDPALRLAVTPDYTFGCKRVLISSDYYPALQQPHVSLRQDGIAHLENDALVSGDGTRIPLDVIVFGTGFHVSEPLLGIDVKGLDGRDLNAEWRANDFQHYLGSAVSGYPNLFFLGGPNTGIGHTSFIFMAECQIHYALQGINSLRQQGLSYLNVTAQAQRQFYAWLQAKMADTVWTSGCHSWYLNERGRNFAIWPDFTYRYWLKTRRLNPAHFHRQPVAALSGDSINAAPI